MARKASSRPNNGSRPTLAKAVLSKLTPNPKRAPPKPVATPEEFGLLQLTFGRHAHGYGIAGAVAFVVVAIFLYNYSALLSLLPAGYAADYFLWLLPAAVGGVVSWDALRLKREPYKEQRSERHYRMSTIGMILFFLISLMMLGMFLGFLPGTFSLWMYPLSVAGVDLTIISMAMTWQGLGGRKATSIFLATFLPLLMTLLVLGNQTIADEGGRRLYLVVYLAGAVATEISGSVLHIIASSTSVHQREILRADNTAVGILQAELLRRREALDYRERGLRGREAHLEAIQQELDGQTRDVKAKMADAIAREALVEKGAKEVRESDRKVMAAKAEVEARAEELKLIESELRSAKSETERRAQALTGRESSAAEREKEVKRIGIELASKIRAVDQKEKGFADQEDRIRDAEKAVEAKWAALLKQEKDVQLRESAVTMKTEHVEATHSKGEKERIRELQDWEAKILAKEKDLAKLEIELRTAEGKLENKSKGATRFEKRFQEERQLLDRREAELVSREKRISDQEEAVKDRLEEVERQASSVQESQTQIDQKMKKYAELLKDAKMKEAAVGSNHEDLKRRDAAMASREKKLEQVQANLQSEIKRLNSENRSLLEQQKELEARESELHVKELELERKSQESREGRQPGIRDMNRESQLEEWERRLREREEDFKRRTYQKEKEIEMREGAVKAHLSRGVSEEAAEQAIAVETRAEKVKTGTPRLDDLLYGGIPFNSNVLFVGPAFVGKEVAILSFVAEGLKKGVPAIIITTTKLPVDIGRDIAPILPTFVEYEQLGLVRWIDSTSTVPGGKPLKEGKVWRVNGPSDFNNILSVLNALDEEFKKAKHPYFRLAYLTLSSSITQADEKEALTFFQKLVTRLRQTKAVSAIALERGMHTDQVLEAMEHMVDGAIHFRSDKQKTVLQVAGLGEVQTREWIPYKFTNKMLMVGSFQLERIR